MRRAHEMPFGAALSASGAFRFRLWAPSAREVQLRLAGRLRPMQLTGDGWWQAEAEARAGDAYAYRIDGRHEVPDPASRAQADDVHGPSLVVDPAAFQWRDDGWRGRPWEETVLYELHVGTFTPEGTFQAVIGRLDHLVSLGVTALELMPVADFPGARDWGYDGVLPFAPDRSYGTPDDLKALVEACHGRGLMVFLDVVYNHFGPEGNYLHLYAPQFFSERHRTPWGAAINFDGEGSRTVRDFFIHNALYWLEEFHLDGLRFDAVHAVKDESRPDILDALAEAVRLQVRDRHVHLVLENDDNRARYMRPGCGKFNAQWNDDFHHALHVILTGEEGGYYEDFAAAPHRLLARALAEGFAFQGEHSPYRGRPRGESSSDLAPRAFVNFLQNHDQIGNRAFGERIASLTSREALRSATALLLLAPTIPLLFMGEEWGSVRPFPFFCDFGADLAPKVSEGRRREFARFLDFSGRRAEAIPDPQTRSTAASAVLQRDDMADEEARAWYLFHRDLLAIRRREIVPRLAAATGDDARAVVIAETVVAAWWRLGADDLIVLANLGSEPVADLKGPEKGLLHATPGAFGDNDTLNGWCVAWYLVEGGAARVRFNGDPVFT